MKEFMTEDFLLDTPTARTLYHDYAEKMPIIDYHCHINPWDIANDARYENITRLWLGGDHFGDHYKWRQIRSNGVPEELVTGGADDRARFQVFAEMLPKAVGNPLFHWTHLELKRYFGYNGILNGDTAEEVWNLCNEKLKTLSVRKIIAMSNVECIATTDDPADDLAAHKKLQADAGCGVRVIPTWRPDKAVNLAKPGFAAYLGRLGEAAGVKITSMQTLEQALLARMEYFDKMGCRASDHGLDCVPYADLAGADLDAILAAALRGEKPGERETAQYQFAVMRFLGRQYARLGWVMQLHYGAVRNTNSRRFAELGADTGFDCMGDPGRAEDLAGFLDSLERTGELPKTILYSLNANDNNMLVSLLGCFQGPECAGKLQHGSAWWFNDTKSGMIRQLTVLAEGGLLGNFIGMLTDSRSFLSYTRHEYFRRILCQLIGGWVENGEYPCDLPALGRLVQDVSYNNCRRYFSL